MINVLDIKNLNVSFKSKKALNNINVEIKSGDFIGLLGSNGAGKSTLINSITGLQKIDSGEINYSDAIIKNKKLPFSSIGFSPQITVMDFYTTVKDNVILGLNLAGITGKEAENLCEKALKTVFLYEKKDKIVDTLSGGQLQRVQIARAIAHEPNFYILDEPTSGLDAESSEAFLTFLKNEVNNGKTVIISSHDIQLLELFCNKILFIKNGVMEFFGPIEEFLDNDSFEVTLTFKDKITERQKDWIKENNYIMEICSDFSCLIKLPKEISILDIMSEFEKEFVIKDFSIKTTQLRDIYLNKVK
ncbi:UNVERIFIED_CONTAM: ABC transporter ATP-binding protein [Streptococcus canis]|uniref:ABC transporter ATP-binding protein n=1 Tax=Streptococcus canis TaxID=1329 RepID=A0AAE4Q531_STRCB|nr:ABC transporter ATP-binding protein [Streptococcus canis]MDV5976589.1 ABC transporter ATP-binding protein [Streptococcus canis]